MASVWYLYTTLADIRVSLPDEQLIVYILHKNETLSGNTWNTCPALGWQQCNYDSIKLPNKKQLHCPEYCFLINAGSLSYKPFHLPRRGGFVPKAQNFVADWKYCVSSLGSFVAFLNLIVLYSEPKQRDKKYNEDVVYHGPRLSRWNCCLCSPLTMHFYLVRLSPLVLTLRKQHNMNYCVILTFATF